MSYMEKTDGFLPPIQYDDELETARAWKKDNKIHYGELSDYLHTGYLVASMRQGLSFEQAQRGWTEFYQKISSEENLDVFFQELQKQKQRELRKGTLQSHSRETLWEYEKFIKTEYSRFEGLTLKNWQYKLPGHKLRKDKALKILDTDYIQLWHGPTGRGKTMLALLIGREAAERGYSVGVERWNYLSDLYSSRRTRNREGFERSPSEHNFSLCGYRLLVIDEYTAGHSAGISQHFFDLIDKRIQRKIKTIIITNETVETFFRSFSGRAGDGLNRGDQLDRRISTEGSVVDFSQLPEWKKKRNADSCVQ